VTTPADYGRQLAAAAEPLTDEQVEAIARAWVGMSDTT
jgi:hypothetical protein